MKRANIFKGTGVALITPFNADGSINFSQLEALADNQINNGADFICVLGTTAETPCLTKEEKKAVIETVVRVNAGRVPLLLGAGCNCTANVIDYINNEVPEGISGFLIVAPYYNKPSQEGLYQHYCSIAKASKLPVVIYNVPGRTGVNVEAETTLRIARDCENVVAIKEASGNISQIEKIIENVPEGFEVLSGDDGLTFELINRGAKGVISVVANAYTAEFSKMVHFCLDKKTEEAARINEKFSGLYPLLFANGNPAGIKGLLSIQHKVENVLRLPLTPVQADTQKGLEEFVNKAESLFNA